MSTNQGQYGNVMENYKGIMLCSRPQEQINLDLNRYRIAVDSSPFISRVHYEEPLGYNPVQKLGVPRVVKSNDYGTLFRNPSRPQETSSVAGCL